jgi:AAA+ ATPase superfamily predicted ATPase
LLGKFKFDIDGYILCKLDSESVNVATSLCSSYNSIAVDKSIKDKIEKLGLKMVLDVRDKAQEWCLIPIKKNLIINALQQLLIHLNSRSLAHCF